MSPASVRRSAIDAIAAINIITGKVDYTTKPLKEVYGEHVFNEEVQRERLPKPVFKALQKTIKAGEELDPAIADAVAVAMKDWAIEHGATHFTHWFQPMTGLTAEKHDSFLVAHAPTAGRWPSSAARNWSTASPTPAASPPAACGRPSRPAATPPGTPPARRSSWTTPTAPRWSSPPCSSAGPARPWTRRPRCCARWRPCNKQALRVLRLFGNTTAKRVFTTVGAEQEYFLIDKHFYFARPDLINCRPHALRRQAAQGPGAGGPVLRLDPRPRAGVHGRDGVRADARSACRSRPGTTKWPPASTRLAPIFEHANLATDHQMLVMEMLAQGRQPVRPGLPAAREALRRHQRLGQAQQLVDGHRRRREPAQPRRHAARQRPVPGLLLRPSCRAVHKYAGLLR